MSVTQPPPVDDAKLQEAEMAAARQMMDGKLVKKTRPRRTVDYTGGVGRWGLVSYHQYHISSSIMHNVYRTVTKTPSKSNICTLLEA